MLEARGLSFAYDGGDPILQEWNAVFLPGEVVAITGPSGRGKSTLLYLLGLMLGPTEGQILLDGIDVTRLSDSRRAALRASNFGFVFQDAALDASRTILDNVIETALYRDEPRDAATGRALQLLQQFGVELQSGAKPGQVSGGQAQRIALCRALLNDPRVLLADEPTGNLDPASADIVVEAFHAQARSGATVVVVTHDPTLVERCTRRIEL
ncbi:MAG: ATP-binding cassette protein [Rhodoglobus sp.]|nr:ATP-binding cassette protein [Rhodoglobus sp.]